MKLKGLGSLLGAYFLSLFPLLSLVGNALGQSLWCVTCGAHQNTSRKQSFVTNDDNIQGEPYWSHFYKYYFFWIFLAKNTKVGSLFNIINFAPMHTRTHLENNRLWQMMTTYRVNHISVFFQRKDAITGYLMAKWIFQKFLMRYLRCTPEHI